MTKRTLLAGLAGLFIAACGGGGDDPDAGGGDDGIDAPGGGPDASMPFEISDVLSLQSGTLIGDEPPELQTSAVLPDSDYLVWVGAYQVNGMNMAPPAKQYGLTLCARQYMPPAAPTCDFTEVNDTNNDTSPANSGQTVGATPFTLCGNLDNKTPVQQRIDADRFSFTVGTAARVEFRLYAATPAPMTANFISIATTGPNPATIGFGIFLGTHGVFSQELEPGNYQVVAESYGAAAPPADVAYNIFVSTDDLDTRCMPLMGNATYTEGYDGAASAGNDLILVRYATMPPLELTPDTADLPERSGITLAPGMSYKLGGDLAVVATQPNDEYKDRDTFLVSTGPGTNQLDVRAQWPDMDADLDYYVFIPIP